MAQKNDQFCLSRHAERRMAQRNVAAGDLSPVIRYGQVAYAAGAEFYFLGKRDLPPKLQLELERLVGTTVVIRHGRVRTVYRNRHAPAKIRRKLKRFIDRSGSAYDNC